MTAVTSDMVYYGAHARTKQASEAKVRPATRARAERI